MSLERRLALAQSNLAQKHSARLHFGSHQYRADQLVTSFNYLNEVLRNASRGGIELKTQAEL